LAAALTDS